VVVPVASLVCFVVVEQPVLPVLPTFRVSMLLAERSHFSLDLRPEARPIVSQYSVGASQTGGLYAPLGAKLLKVTPKAVDLMLAQLGGALPRELTGRTRYRAWGIV
jgi:hypothetical protein